MNFIDYIKKRGVLIAILLFIPIIATLNHFHLIDWMPICPFKHYLNFECFGCGTNRAILSLLKGSFTDSIEQNPLGIIYILALPILAYLDIKNHLHLKNNKHG